VTDAPGKRRPLAGAVARIRRISLLTRFGVISLVLVVALGVVLGQRLQQTLERRTLDDAVRSAEVAANVGIKQLVTPDDLDHDFVPLSEDRRAALDESLGSSLSKNGIVRLKLWNRQHWIVYSDNPRLVNRWFPGDDLIERAFRGETTSEITDLNASEELEERRFGQLLAVYVPLRVGDDGTFARGDDGDVVGAFEIYLPYRPIAAAIEADSRNLSTALAVGLAVLYLALFRLVAGASRRLRRQARENEHLATHDARTGLPNRRLLSEITARTLRSRTDGEHVIMALVDLDRFKEINDTLGHDFGDRLLAEVATRLEERFGQHATVASLGGDEFAVLLPPSSAIEDVPALGIAVGSALEVPFSIDGIDVSVRGSVGLAVAPDDADTPEELLQCADVAMYVAKRNHSHFRRYHPSIDQYDPEHLRLAAEVRRSIDAGHFQLAYQPKVRFDNGEIHGLEALVRWNHPERGLLSPDKFLPIIEHTELIGALTYSLLDQAMGDWRRWADRGWDLPIAVNLAARTVLDPELPGRIHETLARHGAPVSALELELTESAVLADPDEARRSLEVLHDAGLVLAVDDFGTGYASIAYLTELPVSVVKIDMSFARYVTTDPQAAAIVQFTVDLARHLRLAVVAEGVEDQPTFDELATLGCDLAQGYHVCRPQFADVLTTWLESGRYHVRRIDQQELQP